MSINEKRIVVNTTSGKISLARSAQLCSRCAQFSRENADLHREVYRLNHLLEQERVKNNQFDALCEQIKIIKEKLRGKLNEKNSLRHQATSDKSNLHKNWNQHRPALTLSPQDLRGMVQNSQLPKSSPSRKMYLTDRTLNSTDR